MTKHRHSPKPDLNAQLLKLRQTYNEFRGDKSPRQHAEFILTLKTKDERSAALHKIPADIRDIVKHYVLDHFAKLYGRPLPDLARSTIKSQESPLPVDKQPTQDELG